MWLRALVLLVVLPATQALAEKRPLQVDDPQLSPDSQWVAYTVTTDSLEKDKSDRDVWMAPYAGGEAIRVTSSEKSESRPRFSPDGRYLAFLSGRQGDHAQVFVLDRRGGEAQQLTEYKASVSSFAWSPDSKRLALVVSDVDPDNADDVDKKKDDKTKKPIVVRRLVYWNRLRMYKGEVTPGALLTAGGREIERATYAYAVANWCLVNGEKNKAKALFEKIVAGDFWVPFGFIAAEAELARLR